MAFDLSRLRRGEQIAAGAAVLLFIVMFFDWYSVGVDAGPLGESGGGLSAWQAFDFVDIYLLLVILAAVGLAFLTATERSPALPVTGAVIVTALAALGTLLVFYRLINTPIDVEGLDVGRTIWAFIGLIAIAAITYGGYLSMRDEGTSLTDVKEQARAPFDAPAARGQDATSASPPPPPASAPPEPSATPGQSSSAPPPSEPPPSGS